MSDYNDSEYTRDLQQYIVNAQVFAVDDDESNREVLKYNLSDKYQVTTFSSGADFLAKIQEAKPDIVLLDIMMPKMNGYQLCEILKNNPATENIPIIFLSALVSPEDKVKGYELGCEDYLEKPIIFDLLDEKIYANLKKTFDHQRLELKWRNKYSHTTLNVLNHTMAHLFEVGVVLQFYNRAFTCADFSSLAIALAEACEEFQLDVSVQLRSQHGTVHERNEPESLEANLITKNCAVMPGLHWKSRSLFNADKVSIFVKNMPIKDIQRYERLKEHVLVLANAANQRLGVIDAEFTSMMTKHMEMQQVKNAFYRVKDELGEYKNKSRTVFEFLMASLEEKMFGLGLEVDQEHTLLELINTSMGDVDKINDQMAGIINNLADLMANMNRL